MRKEKKENKNKKVEKKEMTMEEFFDAELPHLSDIISFANNLPMSVYADSTVVKSPEVVFRGLALSKNRLISEEYLLNFQRSVCDMGRVIGVNNYYLPMVMGALAQRDLIEDPENLIYLPEYENVNAPIGPVIRSRRSVRHYSGKALSLENLATILFYGQGVSGKLHLNGVPPTATLGKNDKIELRTAPSGGGLYPIDLYVISLNVEKLERGGYLYLPKYHALKPVTELDENFNLSEMAQFGEIEADKANFLIVYGYKLFENSRKYGDSGMAYAFIEVGAISQNVHLICTALGIGPCDIGAYVKSRFEKLLGLDGISQHTVHLTIVGN